MSKATQDKANAYLTEGRIGVAYLAADGADARFYVQGSNLYTILFTEITGWSCDCPAQTECAHIIACKKIVPQLKKTTSPYLQRHRHEVDQELTDFLESR